MSIEERINGFAQDVADAAAGKKSNQDAKRVAKLRKFLVQCQDEQLPKALQSKLSDVAQRWHAVLTREDPAVDAADTQRRRDVLEGLLEDLLAMPEGKLVSAAAKRVYLKQLEKLQGERAAGKSGKGTGGGTGEEEDEEEKPWRRREDDWVFDSDSDIEGN